MEKPVEVAALIDRAVSGRRVFIIVDIGVPDRTLTVQKFERAPVPELRMLSDTDKIIGKGATFFTEDPQGVCVKVDDLR